MTIDITLMAHTLTFASGKTFVPGSHIMFETIDIPDELRLAVPNELVTMGAQHARFTRSKTEKRHLKGASPP